MYKTKTAISILLFIFSLNPALSQKFELSTPLFPSPNELPQESIGGFIGIGQNYQSGFHYVNCDGCEFNNGVDAGFTFGMLYQRNLTGNLYWGGYLTADIRGITSSYLESETTDITNDKGLPDSIPVTYRHTAESDFFYLGIAPYLYYNPFGFFSFRAAPKVDFLLNSNILHSKQAVDDELNISPTEGYFQVQDSVVQDTEFSETVSPLFGLDLSIMLNTNTSENTSLSFGYTHYIPFSNTSEFGDNFKISSWRLFLEFKYTLDEAFENKPSYKNSD